MGYLSSETQTLRLKILNGGLKGIIAVESKCSLRIKISFLQTFHKQYYKHQLFTTLRTIVILSKYSGFKLNGMFSSP